MEDPDADWIIEENPHVDWKIRNDPYVEWKIEDYPSSPEYVEDEGKSNVKWILEKGLGIGKKVVITGFLISSVPLVLPSVVIVSAVGFTVSVPFGLVYASYACTQGLMNKLLPLPSSSPRLRYDKMYEDEDVRDGEPNEEVGIEYMNMEEEEREQMEDIRDSIEKRIELVMDENKLPQQYGDNLNDIRKDEEAGVRYQSGLAEEKDDHLEGIVPDEGVRKKIELVMHENELPQEDDHDLKDIRTDEEERLATGDETFMEKGYEEDVDESLEVKEDVSGELIDDKIHGQEREGDDETIVEKRKGEELLPEAKRIFVAIGGEKTSDGKPEGSVVVVRRVGAETRNSKRETENEEEKDLKKETVGLLEKIRDQGDASDAVKKMKKENKGGAEKSLEGGKDGHRIGAVVSDLENPVEKENVHMEIFLHTAEGDDEKETGRSSDKYKGNVIEAGSLLDVKNKKLQKVMEEVIGLERMNEDEKYVREISTEQGAAAKDNLENALKDSEPAIETEGIMLTKKDAGKSDDVASGELTMHYSTLVHGKQHAENGQCLLEETQKPERSSEVMVQQPGIGQDIDTELYKALIPEEENVIYRNGVTKESTDLLAGQKLREVHEEYHGNERAMGRASNEKVDVVEVSVASTRPKSRHDGQRSLQVSVLSPEKGSVIDDHKIYEQIDALKTIVGYRATPHRSCKEEVKALYIFTGVEPPSSFEKATSSAELSDVLRFLMSIVGVK